MTASGNSMNSKATASAKLRAKDIANELANIWPDAVCEIDHKDPYQLLVGTILAAQSTDKRINLLSPALFARYPNANALAQADQAELEKLIFSSGFYRAKAKNLLAMAQAVVRDHDGEIPQTMEELVALAGVARKTANVVLGNGYGIAAGIVVDTHVTRLAARLGLTTNTDPVKIEQDLCGLIPQSQWVEFANRVIFHGRRVCHAKKPDCDRCQLAPLCPSVVLAADLTKKVRVKVKAKATKPASKPKRATTKPKAAVSRAARSERATATKRKAK